MLSALYAAVAEAGGGRLGGDKSPNDLKFTRILLTADLFAEDLPVIHVVRDVRDVMASFKDLGWADGRARGARPPLGGQQPDGPDQRPAAGQPVPAGPLRGRGRATPRASSGPCATCSAWTGTRGCSTTSGGTSSSTAHQEIGQHARTFEPITAARVGTHREAFDEATVARITDLGPGGPGRLRLLPRSPMASDLPVIGGESEASSRVSGRGTRRAGGGRAAGERVPAVTWASSSGARSATAGVGAQLVEQGLPHLVPQPGAGLAPSR